MMMMLTKMRENEKDGNVFVDDENDLQQKEIDGAWYKWVQMERQKKEDKSKIAANKNTKNKKKNSKRE